MECVIAFEARSRDRIHRDERVFRDFLERKCNALRHDTAFFPERPARSISPTHTETSHAESMISTHSSLQSASITSSVVLSAVAAATGTELDVVLEQMRLRHEQHAKRMSRYPKVHRAGAGHAADAAAVLEQQEEEQRGDIATVEAVWRSEMQQQAHAASAYQRTRAETLEVTARQQIVFSEQAEWRSLCGTRHLLDSEEHYWRISQRAQRSHANIGNVATPKLDAGAELVSRALDRFERTRRRELVEAEQTSRVQMYEAYELWLHPVVLCTASTTRCFDGFSPAPPTADRLRFVKAMLLQRKSVAADAERGRELVVEAEAAARHRLLLSVEQSVLRRLGVPDPMRCSTK